MTLSTKKSLILKENKTAFYTESQLLKGDYTNPPHSLSLQDTLRTLTALFLYSEANLRRGDSVHGGFTDEFLSFGCRVSRDYGRVPRIVI